MTEQNANRAMLVVTCIVVAGVVFVFFRGLFPAWSDERLLLTSTVWGALCSATIAFMIGGTGRGA